MSEVWKFQPDSFGSSSASTFRKLMVRQELSAAELVAREVLQNSEDAAQKFRKEIQKSDIPFRVDFRFHRLDGTAKKRLIEATGLNDLLSYAKSVGPAELGIKEVVDVDGLLRSKPLEILEMSDFGARGLRRSPKAMVQSAYYNCLLVVGNSKDKDGGAGGSYGFGKSAFINGSNIATVLAYSCFQDSGASDPATRRFGGVAYWNDHFSPLDETPRTGLGAFGNPADPHLWTDLPYEDHYADELASACGLELRSPSKLNEHGTSILVLCPAVEPEDLGPAIEKYWWPALVGIPQRMQVRVIDYEGKSQAISPKQNSSLRGFLRAYEMATTDSNPNSTFEFKKKIPGNITNGEVGIFSAVADPTTCFDPKRADGTPKVSQVCLIRAPRMVVKYLDFGKGAASAPFIDGVFVSSNDDKVESLLRGSEPPTHDYWWQSSDKARKEKRKTEPELYSLLESIRTGVTLAVNEFKALIRPPVVREKTGLKNFGRLLSKIMSDDGTGGQITGKSDPFKIHFRSGPTPTLLRQGYISYSTEVDIGVKPEAGLSEYEVSIAFIYRVIEEEDGQGEEISSSHTIVSAPEGFGTNGIAGRLKKGDTLRVRFDSAPLEDGKSVSGQCRVRNTSPGKQLGASNAK